MGRFIQLIGILLFVPSVILLLAGFASGSTSLPLILGIVGVIITIARLYTGRRMVKSSQARTGS